MTDSLSNTSVTTSQLLQPQRLEGETYEEYVKRRKDMQKVLAQHLSCRGPYNAEYHLKSTRRNT